MSRSMKPLYCVESGSRDAETLPHICLHLNAHNCVRAKLNHMDAIAQHPCNTTCLNGYEQSEIQGREQGHTGVT